MFSKYSWVTESFDFSFSWTDFTSAHHGIIWLSVGVNISLWDFICLLFSLFTTGRTWLSDWTEVLFSLHHSKLRHWYEQKYLPYVHPIMWHINNPDYLFVDLEGWLVWYTIIKTYLESLAENSQIPKNASLGLRDLGTPVWKTLHYNKSLFFSVYFHDVCFVLRGSVVSDSLRPHGL